MHGRSHLIAGTCLGALLAGWAPGSYPQASGSALQTTFKCADERRRITYSNVPCDRQGMKDAGKVANRTSSMPMGAAPKGAAQKAPAPRGRAAAPTKAQDDAEVARAPAKVQPVNPLIDTLLK